jgi:hypothetical protein
MQQLDRLHDNDQPHLRNASYSLLISDSSTDAYLCPIAVFPVRGRKQVSAQRVITRARQLATVGPGQLCPQFLGRIRIKLTDGSHAIGSRYPPAETVFADMTTCTILCREPCHV